jgi:pantoate--beta-alanine ligase
MLRFHPQIGALPGLLTTVYGEGNHHTRRVIRGAGSVQTISWLQNLRITLASLRQNGKIALVPTMGALHSGHLSLVKAAQAQGAQVVASIFVNPRQFSAGEDLDAYPRQLERDKALLEAAGVAVLWAPTPEVMYPAGYATNISVSGVSEGLCGATRPGHFDGVATVVCKLFNQVQPDMAFFGEKDWQQLAVIRTMARDLDMALPASEAIIAVPTLREEDGLAMSSRNAYLSPQQRAQAPALPRAMQAALAAIRNGQSVAEALASLRAAVLAAGFASVDYAELRDAASLALLDEAPQTAPARLLVAARLGKARLIDNMPL